MALSFVHVEDKFNESGRLFGEMENTDSSQHLQIVMSLVEFQMDGFVPNKKYLLHLQKAEPNGKA